MMIITASTSKKYCPVTKFLDANIQPPTFLQRCVSFHIVLMRENLADNFEILVINDETTDFKIRCFYQMDKL